MSAQLRSYRIVATAQPKNAGREGAGAYRIVVPARLARLIPPDVEFIPEITEDGLLYRRVLAPATDLPSWVLAPFNDYCDVATDSAHSSAHGLDSR